MRRQQNHPHTARRVLWSTAGLVWLASAALVFPSANAATRDVVSSTTSPLQFVGLTGRVKTEVQTFTALQLPMPQGLPQVAQDYRSAGFGQRALQHWLIQGVANSQQINLAWSGFLAGAQTSVVQIAASAKAASHLMETHPHSSQGDVSLPIWTFAAHRLRNARPAPWKIPLGTRRREVWQVTWSSTAAPKAVRVPGSMEAQTIAGHRVFRVRTKANGRLQSYWWYQRGWLINLSPQAGSATKAVIQTVAAVDRLPMIAHGAGMVFMEPGYTAGQYAYWLDGSVEYTVSNAYSMLALATLVQDLPSSFGA